MKYRLLLPAFYIVLVSLFFLLFFRGLGGHGPNPFEFVTYLVMPACYLLNLLPASWGPQDGLGLVFLCFAVGLIQWVLIGYLIDKILQRVRKKKLKL